MERWKDRIKKCLAWRADQKTTAIAAAAVLLALLLPLCILSFYSAPWYDDYIYGRFVRNFLQEENSLSSALKGALYCVHTEWWAWQGTFSSIFFMAFVPFVWEESWYALGPLFLILLLVVSVFVLVRVLAADVLKADKWICLLLQSVTAAMAVVLMYHAQEGYYWYIGGIHYVGMHSFLLLLIAAWVKLMNGAGKAAAAGLVLWSLLGAVLAGGSNYVSTLQGLLVGLSLLALGAVLKNRRVCLIIPSLALYGYAFYKNVSAPGNAKRSAAFQGAGLEPAEAVLCSFQEAVAYLWEFSGLITIAISLLLAPVIWNMVKKSSLHFRWPGLLLAWSFCLYATGFTPSLYAMGHAGLGRTLNAVKLTWQILFLINEVYWLGWIQARQAERGKPEKSRAGGGVPIAFYAVMAIMILGIFKIDGNKIAHYSSWGAYCYLRDGEAQRFHQEYLERVEAIKEGGPVVTVKPLETRPWLLSPGELSEDPYSEPNMAMADWYDKEAIICQP